MLALPVTIQTLYAELVEQLLALEARRTIGHSRGAIVTKTLKRGQYYYFQYSEPGGTVRQAYLGPRSPSLDATLRRFEAGRDAAQADRDSIRSVCAALRAGGAATTDASSARVLGALADSGVFKLGGVLVGTQAFLVLGNVLGVKWAGGAMRTEDIDVGAARNLEVAVPDLRADVPAVLEGLGMGFLPVPGFSPKAPFTSFKVRGRGLRVDLVTPANSSSSKPVPIPRLHAAAAPVRFLDYALEGAQPAAVVDGGGVLVSVPSPARFAVLKLLVAQDRPAAFQAKARKDVAQAAYLVEALESQRPGDLELARKDARARGKRWRAALDRGVELLRRVDADAAMRLG
jgi:hypothetical protein